jgi:hypothetical protein
MLTASQRLAALLLLAASVPAFAGQADVCYSPTAPDGQAVKLTASTVLDCPTAGRHTVPQLAASGWSVASVQPVVTDYRVDAATHTPQSEAAWMVVVQRTTP